MLVILLLNGGLAACVAGWLARALFGRYEWKTPGTNIGVASFRTTYGGRRLPKRQAGSALRTFRTSTKEVILTIYGRLVRGTPSFFIAEFRQKLSTNKYLFLADLSRKNIYFRYEVLWQALFQ